jgi:hypothetical protein
MEEKIYQILKKHRLPLKKREEVLADLLILLGGVERSEHLCDLDGKTVKVIFKVTEYTPQIIIEDV